MSGRGLPNRHFRHTVAALVAAATLAHAQSPQLDAARAAQSLADQKAADDVTRALAEAANLATLTTPARAAERLKQSLTALDLSASISADKRKELVKKLDAAIAKYEGGKPAADANQSARREADKKLRQQAADEWATISAGLAKAREFAEAGNAEAAARQTAALQARYPANPQVQALGRQRLTADLLRQNERDAKEYQLAWVGNLREVERGMIPVAGDIQFPDAKRWKELTKARRQMDEIKLSPKEQKLLESLNKTVGALFQDRPFEEALQDLSNMIGEEIHIDRESLKEAGLDLGKRVSFKGSVSGRTALRALLQANGLTFIVKDELIQVVTIERAERELTTRSYYLGDVLSGGMFTNAVVWGPVASYQQTMENARVLVETIRNSVDTRCWRQNGGPCSVEFNLATMSVVVRASTEVHAAFAGSVSGRK